MVLYKLKTLPFFKRNKKFFLCLLLIDSPSKFPFFIYFFFFLFFRVYRVGIKDWVATLYNFLLVFQFKFGGIRTRTGETPSLVEHHENISNICVTTPPDIILPLLFLFPERIGNKFTFFKAVTRYCAFYQINESISSSNLLQNLYL